jgi:hypothetical protein
MLCPRVGGAMFAYEFVCDRMNGTSLYSRDLSAHLLLDLILKNTSSPSTL